MLLADKLSQSQLKSSTVPTRLFDIFFQGFALVFQLELVEMLRNQNPCSQARVCVFGNFPGELDQNAMRDWCSELSRFLYTAAEMSQTPLTGNNRCRLGGQPTGPDTP